MTQYNMTYKYIYGPVYSWRLGYSLGIDPLSQKDKICTFDCAYCQLGNTKAFKGTRKNFVPVQKIIDEIKTLPPVKIDYITFSGRGEPALAKNLGAMIKAVKKIRKEKVAVITNASLVYRKDVRRDLCLADFVMLKLDAGSLDVFHKINKPIQTVKFNNILKGIKDFMKVYKKKSAVQIMFTKDNLNEAKYLAELAGELGFKEVQICTPLRESKVEPLSRKEINKVKKYFRGMDVKSVYDVKYKAVTAIDKKGVSKRHGVYSR